jgi:hypothetical protein
VVAVFVKDLHELLARHGLDLSFLRVTIKEGEFSRRKGRLPIEADLPAQLLTEVHTAEAKS